MSGPSSPGAIRPDAEIRRMFGRIVRRYDLMNRLMTGGRDGAWRDHAAREALAVGRNRVLDLATGTGDLAFALARAGAERVVGVDFAEPMIRAAEAKRGRGADRAVGSNVAFLVGDAMRLPFADGQFDAATVSFGLRNMKDYAGAIAEVRRVLRPGAVFAGSDSRASVVFRLAHVADTMTLVDPDRFAQRLTANGFEAADVDVAKGAFRFRARVPATVAA